MPLLTDDLKSARQSYELLESRLQSAEQRAETLQAALRVQPPPLLDEIRLLRQRILALAHNVPVVWNAPTTSQAERKQLLRYLIKDVTLSRRETIIEVRIRWRTEALTDLIENEPDVTRSCYAQSSVSDEPHRPDTRALHVARPCGRGDSNSQGLSPTGS